MRRIAESELVLNPDGSVYHLNLKPEHVSGTVIFVGDPGRVDKVASFFDRKEFETRKREFHTVTGSYKGKRITVISTGIGPDNIDIVMNELDALVNIDLQTRTVKDKLTSLTIVRIGTSGSLQADIPVDHFVMADYGIGFDGMLWSYACGEVVDTEMAEAFVRHTGWDRRKPFPYIVGNHKALGESLLGGERVHRGITATAGGFFGPQGRVLRLPLQDPELNGKIDSFRYGEHRITNLEMETAAIYGLAKLMGHKACSMNCIIANRANLTFSRDPYASVKNLIQYTLDKLVLL